MTDDRERRAAEARAHREEKAFVSIAAEQIEQAGRQLRTATLMAPDERRSAVVAEVVAALEAAAETLRARI